MDELIEKNNRLNKSGFTILEVIISVSLFAVIVAGLSSILITSSNLLAAVSGRTDLMNNSNKCMTLLIKELRSSSVNKVLILGQPADEGENQDFSNGKSIVFQVPVDYEPDGDYFDEEGFVEWGAEGNLSYSIEYYWDDVALQLYRRIWNADSVQVSDILIAENISLFKIEGLYYDSEAAVYDTAVVGDMGKPLEIAEITITSQKDTILGKILDVPIEATLINKINWRN